MKIKGWKLPVFLGIFLIIIKVLSNYTVFIENYYSMGIYPIIARVLSGLTSLFPFSVGEAAIGLIVVLVLVYLIRLIRTFRRDSFSNVFKSRVYIYYLRNTASAVLIILILFQLLWGLNYSRLPLKAILGLEVKPRSSAELYDAMVWHVDRANALSLQLTYEMYAKKYYVWEGYEALPEGLSALSQVKGRPKDLVSSEFFSYAGIAGIYNPFFGEPNFNGLQVDYMHPVVQAHELAHLQGVAREDEANFTAVAVCLSHEEPLVNYSGHMLAIIHMSNALYAVDHELWLEANTRINERVRSDLDRNNAFWEKYEGWFEEASSNLNDTYLKANGLEDGIKSYGRMIDLLLATKDLFYTSFN